MLKTEKGSIYETEPKRLVLLLNKGLNLLKSAAATLLIKWRPYFYRWRKVQHLWDLGID